MVGKIDLDLNIMLTNITDPAWVGMDLAIVVGIVVDDGDDVVVFVGKVVNHVEVIAIVELLAGFVFETVSVI